MSDLDPQNNALACYAPFNDKDPKFSSELPTARPACSDVTDESLERITIDARRLGCLNWLRHIIVPGEITEVFVKNARGIGKHLTGFYDSENLEALVQHTVGTFIAPAALYFRTNPVNESFLVRAPNQLRPSIEVEPSRTENISRRRRIMIDLDPIRSGPGCATNEEKHFAQQKLERVLDFLNELNWPPEATIDTGNGFCIYLRVDLPTDEQGLVKEFLATLGREFNDEHVRVDRSVHDAMRLGRLPGTWNCKGDNTTERPHRLCQILTVAEEDDIAVTRSQIEGLVGGRSKSSANLRGALRKVTKNQLLRAKAYVAQMPPAIEGQGGHNRTFAVACRLVIDFAIPPAQALPLMREYNERCSPPWSEQELWHKLVGAEQQRTDAESDSDAPDRSQYVSRGVENAADNLDGPQFLGFIPDFGETSFSDARNQFFHNSAAPASAFVRLVHFVQWRKFDSGILVPDVMLRQLIWGSRPPRNWRKELLKHAQLRTCEQRGDHNVCQSQTCLFHSLDVRHQHFPNCVRTWGVLERFVVRSETILRPIEECDQRFIEYDRAGMSSPPRRSFEVYCDNRDALIYARKWWLIAPIYWPAYLLGASRKIGWLRKQQQAIFAITREVTRACRFSRDSQFEIIENAEVATAGRGNQKIPCPILNPSITYVVFGGNGRRRGRGYQLFGRSMMGWLPRMGFARADVSAELIRKELLKGFLLEMEQLSNDLGLVFVGYNPATCRGKWKGLDEMLRATKTRFGLEWLQNCSVRVYTAADWLVRWRQFLSRKLGFNWIPRFIDDRGPDSDRHSNFPSQPSTAELVELVMHKFSLTQSQLAYALSSVMKCPVSRQRVGRHLHGTSDHATVRMWLEEFLEVAEIDS